MIRASLKCLIFIVFVSTNAFAHHLDEYDERIRAEAQLPNDWFSCKTEKDCDLVSVPCQSDLAINAKHVTEAREALINHYWICLGSSQHDSQAMCDEHQCTTKSLKPTP
jgi:hypothetical protein